MTSGLPFDDSRIKLELVLDFLHVPGLFLCLQVATNFRSKRLVMWPHTSEYLGVDECAKSFGNCADLESAQSWDPLVDVAVLVIVGDELAVLVMF